MPELSIHDRVDYLVMLLTPHEGDPQDSKLEAYQKEFYPYVETLLTDGEPIEGGRQADLHMAAHFLREFANGTVFNDRTVGAMKLADLSASLSVVLSRYQIKKKR